MTISKKQLKANRENAKKSKGPKTSKGIDTIKKHNSVHGLYTDELILNSAHRKEDRVEFELMLESLRHELDPTTLSQDYQVQKIAVCYWRGRRVVAAETAHINNQLNSIEDEWKYKQMLRGLVVETVGSYEVTDVERDAYIANRIGVNSICSDGFAKVVLRYELRIDRQMTRCYRLFYQLKAREELVEARRAKEKRKKLLERE